MRPEDRHLPSPLSALNPLRFPYPPIDTKPEAILRWIAERQERLSALDARIRATAAAPGAIETELSRLEAQATQRLQRLRETLQRQPGEARKVLETIFEGPLTFSPLDTDNGKRFRIEGAPSIAKMLIEAGVSNSASLPGRI